MQNTSSGEGSDGEDAPSLVFPFLSTAGSSRATAANRLGLDYHAAAKVLPHADRYRGQIVDIHAHVMGATASDIFRAQAEAFGVQRVYSMSRLEDARVLGRKHGEFVRFIAFPNFREGDRVRAMGEGFLDDIRAFRQEHDARIVKFWNAPRLRELLGPTEYARVGAFDSPGRVKAAELAQSLGMMMMVHVADPDTWFQTKYADHAKYGEKREHYDPLRRMMRRFPGPWILAHGGGNPENLEFLSELLDDHANCFIDFSATKWIVREISRQPLDKARAFFARYRGRLLFGSDVVATDEHLRSSASAHPMGDLADTPQAAAELYASRYFALRLLFETTYTGESPIADPDLAMVDPSRFTAMSAPTLRGLDLPREDLDALYFASAEALLANFGGV